MIKKTPSMLILSLLVGFPQLSETIYTPSLPEMSRFFNTSANMMQQSLSIYFLGFAVGVFVFGRLADILGRYKALLLGLCFYIIGTLACLFSPHIGFFLLARFVQAFGASVGSVVVMTMLRDLFEGKKLQDIFSKLTAVLAFAPGLGPLIGSCLSFYFSPQANFIFLLGLGFLLFFLCLKGMSETKPENLKHLPLLPIFKRMFKDPHILLSAFFIAAHNGILFSLHAEAPFIFIELLKMDPTHFGILGAVMASSIFAGSMINTKMLKKYSSFSMNMFGTVLLAISAALLLLSTSLFTVVSQQIMQIILLLLLSSLTLGVGISLPNCLSFSLKDYSDCKGSAGAILGLLYYLLIGGLLGVMSIIHDGSIMPMPSYFFLLGLLMLGAAWLILFRQKREFKLRQNQTVQA